MKNMLLIGLLMLSKSRLHACDICGGVSGNASIGLFASSSFHMMGLKTQTQVFASYLNGIRHSQEIIFRNDLNFRMQITKRLQVMAMVPYQYAWQLRDLGSDFKSGLGDPLVMGNVILFHKKDTSGITKHFVSGALGVKFPLGKYGSNESSLMNLYPGTGGFDGLVMMNYTKGWNKGWSFQNEASWSIKSANPNGYRYGNVLQLSTLFLKNQKWQLMRIIPAFGFQFNHFKRSSINGQILNESNNSGYTFSGKIALNVMTYKWLLGISSQIPFLQNVNSGITKQFFGAEISCTYLLKSKKSKNEKE
jgi:hypothetical protein